MKDLIIEGTNWEKTNVKIKIETRSQNNQIAILLYEKETGKYYGELGNFHEDSHPYFMCMAIDTLKIPNAEHFIQKYNLWVYVDVINNGFWPYPLYAMNISELFKYDHDWASKLLDRNV